MVFVLSNAKLFFFFWVKDICWHFSAALHRILFASARLFLHIFCTAVTLLTHSFAILEKKKQLNIHIIFFSVKTAETAVITFPENQFDLG